MRIRAIRGMNLASLPTFKVDLDAEPLAGAGLFAITGPTGAGKSTLLDAMCLALYDKTPRLRDRGGPKIGRADDEHRLPANDVRNLLRRGAGAGYAEIDFVGNDGQTYRARWTVRRSRNKADGRFQPQKTEFERLDEDGEVAAILTTDRKTDTLQLIEQKVGLNFDQFRRSVLLAQGEFDRFLKADKKERGELLERITGADLYRRLGQAAHEKRRSLEIDRAEARARVEGVEVLEHAARAALDLRVGSGEAWVEAAESRRVTLEAAGRWFTGHRTLSAAEDDALIRADEAETRADAAEPLRARLEAVEAAEPLREPLREADSAIAEARQAEQQATERARALVEAEQAVVVARDDESAAVLAGEGVRAELAAEAPTIAEARRQDAALAEAERAVERAQARVDRLRPPADEAAAKLRLEQAARAEHAEMIAHAEGWLTEHQRVAPVHAQWSRWAEQLEALGRARQTAVAARAEAQAHAEGTRAAQAEVAEADAGHARARQDLEVARAAVSPAALAEAEAAIEAAETRIQALSDKRLALQSLLDRAREARRQGALLDAATVRRSELKKVVKSQRSRIARLARRIEERRDQIGDAVKRLSLMRAAQALADHRAALVEGEPCPLCGATEHPGMPDEADTARLVEGEESALAALRARDADDLKQRALAEERANVAADDVADAEQEIDRARSALNTVLADWEMARLSYGADVPDDPQADDADASLRRRIEACHADRETAETRRGEARARRARLEAARETVESLRTAVDTARGGLERARDAHRAADVERERASDRAALAEARAETLRETLDDLFSAWPEWAGALDALSGFVQVVEARVEAFGRYTASLARARVALDTAERTLAGLAAEAEQRAAALTVARDEVAQAEVERQSVTRARAALLGGRPVEAVEATHRRRREAADAEVSAARDARAAAEARAESAAEMDADAARAVMRAQRRAEDARGLLDEAMADARIDEETLRERLAEGPDWVRQTRDRLATLDQAVHTAQAVLSERRGLRLAHESTGRPEVDPAEIDEALAIARAALDAFRAAVEDDRSAQRQDDKARTIREALDPELAAIETEYRRWADLASLIGSHDGTTFRDFAQSLTLDAVVGLANQHLLELARRYRLMRVPNEDLELQVIDRDMGDEIRSVQSLSGGECFLVSLALALGLASLSAREARLESLFIDEGFGTLDVDTLQTVLATLDALQSTGRQVGLISHVPGIEELIGVQVRVSPVAPGRSAVQVVGVGG